jgi:pseudaminic acid biosynthesis-associated methylase
MAADEPKALGAWSGEFGDRYTERNAASIDAVRGRTRVWAEVFRPIVGDMPASALEVGPNVGLNLRGIQALAPMDLWGIEPNPAARERLVADGVLPADRVIEGFGHEIPMADRSVDLAFTSGVLIHVDPTLLERTMREIHRVSAKYVFCAEYFSPKAETIPYRGETDLLFKNDFGSLYLDLFPDLRLVDYGFFWRRTTVMDDSTWWLFRKA